MPLVVVVGFGVVVPRATANLRHSYCRMLTGRRLPSLIPETTNAIGLLSQELPKSRASLRAKGSVVANLTCPEEADTSACELYGHHQK